MKRSKKEFGVVKTLRDDDHLMVDGRCFEGPLAVGDVFRQLYRLAPVVPKTEAGWNLVAADFRQVSLRIDDIIYFRQSIESLSTGHTARLSLAGDGLELVRDDGYEVLGIELDA